MLGGLLCPGARTITNCLRVLGLTDGADFGKYHRVLSRAPWSGLDCAGTLLRLLTRAFAHSDHGANSDSGDGGPLVFALDETIERRWGRRTDRGSHRCARPVNPVERRS